MREKKLKNRTCGGRFVAFCCMFLLLPGVCGWTQNFSFQGSYKTYQMGSYNPFYNNGLYGASFNGLRLKSALYPTGWMDVNISYEVSADIRYREQMDEGNNSFLLFGSNANGYRAFDLPSDLYPWDDEAWNDEEPKNMVINQNLDRANLFFYLPFGDLAIGRQAVSWGSGHVMNPTDVFSAFTFNQRNTEYKSGIDAIRLRIPFGMMHEMDTGYVAGEDFSLEKSAFFLRTRLYLFQTDVALMFMDRKEDLFVGLDIARAVGGAGVWMEASYVAPDLFISEEDLLGEERPNFGEADYIAGCAGIDYSFTGKLYGSLEYYYNSAGKTAPEDYLEIWTKPSENPAYGAGDVYLMGQHYLNAGGSYTVMPLLPLYASVTANLNDFSVNITLSGEYNASPNLYISGGCILGVGERPDTRGGPSTDQPISIVSYHSEFGSYPAMVYTAVKYYF